MILLSDCAAKAVSPKMPKARREMVLASIGPALTRYEINTVNRLAAFIAQTAHESAQFTADRENLNHSADALQRVFRKYFPTRALALAYARRPAAIANRAYSLRMGNGDEDSGDGFKFSGAVIFANHRPRQRHGNRQYARHHDR